MTLKRYFKEYFSRGVVAVFTNEVKWFVQTRYWRGFFKERQPTLSFIVFILAFPAFYWEGPPSHLNSILDETYKA